MKKGLAFKGLKSKSQSAYARGIRLRLANGRFATTGRTLASVKGRARRNFNSKNAVAGVKYDLMKKTGSPKRRVAFEAIQQKGDYTSYKARQKGYTGESFRSHFRDKQNRRFGVGGDAPPKTGFNAFANARGRFKGMEWNAGFSYSKNMVKVAAVTALAGGVLKYSSDWFTRKKGSK